MKPFAFTWLLVFLLTSAACSTAERVITKTEPVYLEPSAGLLVQCPRPQLVPSNTTFDVVMNSLERQSKFDECDARHRCLLEWHQWAAKVAESKGTAVPVPAACGQYTQQ